MNSNDSANNLMNTMKLDFSNDDYRINTQTITPRINEKNDVHILESKYIQTDFKTINSSEKDESRR